MVGVTGDSTMNGCLKVKDTTKILTPFKTRFYRKRYNVMRTYFSQKW